MIMEDSGIDSDSKSNSNDACSTPNKILFLEEVQSSAVKDSSPSEDASKNDEHDWRSQKDSVLEDLLQKKQAEETETNCQPKKILNSNQLQKRLEKQILEAKKIRQQSKAETTDAQRRSLIPRNSRLSVPNKVILTPVVTKADEQPLVTWESDSDDEFDFHPMTRAATKEITQQLKKDGYNLDLTPDDEDLDLIPPKPLNERCTCCHPGYGCIIV